MWGGHYESKTIYWSRQWTTWEKLIQYSHM